MKKFYQDQYVVLHLDLDSRRLIIYDIQSQKIQYQEIWSTQFDVECGDMEYSFVLGHGFADGEILCGSCWCKNTKTGTEVRKLWYGKDV